MNVAGHLERFLGQMDRGWSSSSLPGVQVCLFQNQPCAGYNTFSTLGLSDAVLEMGSGRQVRQELLFATRDIGSAEQIGKLLFHVAETLIKTGHALLRGEVIPVEGRIIESSNAGALYVSMPIAFHEGLAILDDSNPATVMVWLIPLQPAEENFIAQNGWDVFEDRLEAAQPDLLDIQRQAAV